jgi:Arc/MetJ-type ribon-helix-helix transcriptional regulator
MPSSVQLDPETEIALEHLALRKEQSRSEIVRQAIELLASQEEESSFERVADLIDCVSGGPPDLTEETGKGLCQQVSTHPTLKELLQAETPRFEMPASSRRQ